MILADTHVHAHPCFDIQAFLDAALTRMQPQDRHTDPIDRVLCLTEAAGQHVFRDWTSRQDRIIAGSWRVCAVADSCSLRIQRDSEASLRIVAGRQIVTTERLEILCLGHDADIPDRVHPLAELTAMILKIGGLPVLPWGFGKWTGARGRAVKAFLEQASVPDGFCLGDNANRPRLWPEPELFRIARKKNVAILPGSDPLPLASACADVGRYGLRLNGSLPDATPWSHLRSRLANPDTGCLPYGRRESLMRFIWNQTRLRLPH